ncbi:MAG: transcriptional regulator [Ahniella sp.]|nr:transcriptional regulator [Ahniella sp.]
MKSQDVMLLLKLVSLKRQETTEPAALKSLLGIPDDWHSWVDKEISFSRAPSDEDWSVRGLENSTGISKSQVSGALRRCIAVGLAHADRRSGRLRANTQALIGLIIHGVKFVFPAQRGPLVRGIATTFAAPVLAGKLLTAGQHPDVWEDASGTLLGQRVEPLHPAVPHAVRRDPTLYAMLALVDAIRLGRERETALSASILEKYLQGHT